MAIQMGGEGLEEAKVKHQNHLGDAERALRMIRKELTRAQRQQPKTDSEEESDSDATDSDEPALMRLPLKARSQPGTEVITSDFQANLMTPKLTVGEAFYMRKLKTYNYGIYSGTRNKHTMVFWDEKTGHKVNTPTCTVIVTCSSCPCA